jgi:hypothetical protein
MTRRAFAGLLAAAPLLAQPPVTVPVYLIVDKRAKITPAQLAVFSNEIWPEAVRDFQRVGIRLESGQGVGEVRRAPSGRPLFAGLARGAVNLVLTDAIPMEWDNGRGLAGVATLYDGLPLCLVALPRAHGHQVPFVSVNTCVHELLHVLLQDIAEARPKGLEGRGRELRIDWYATRLWLFRDGADIRRSAAECLRKLSLSGTPAG